MYLLIILLTVLLLFGGGGYTYSTWGSGLPLWGGNVLYVLAALVLVLIIVSLLHSGPRGL
jgi:hypothetical protein